MSTPPVDRPTVARAAFRVGGDLAGLVELLEETRVKPDGYSLAEVAEVARALQGLAFRIAVGSGDAELMAELTGLPWRPLEGPGVTEGDQDSRP